MPSIASSEVSTYDEAILGTLPQLLAQGTSIYVAHTPRATLDDVVRVALKIEALGFRAFPHLAARRIQDERKLRTALKQLSDGGISRALLIAGDRNLPQGEFSDTLQVLDCGALADHGFQTLGVAGHPEGHPAVVPARLWDALKRKQAYAVETRATIHIVTQFSFRAEAVFGWESRLLDLGITLPVHVGVAGPTPLRKLLKYALQCGVGVSNGAVMKALGALGSSAGLVASADEILFDIGRCHAGRPHTLIRQPHFYAFGGIKATALWMRALRSGRFEVNEDRKRLLVDA